MRQTDTGALIAQLRKEQGLTQKQLADQLHISDRTIIDQEAHQSPNYPHITFRCSLTLSQFSAVFNTF